MSPSIWNLVTPATPSRLRKNSVYTLKSKQNLANGADNKIIAGCSKRPSSKAAVSEEARRTLRYVEPLSDARTPLADFFSILLEPNDHNRPINIASHR